MKNLLISLSAVILLGCAAKNMPNLEQKNLDKEQSAVIKANGFLTPQEAAKWCFEALISANGAGFYERCSLKGIASLKDLRKSRWERIANDAALKVEKSGGLVSLKIGCKQNASADKAVCKLAYRLGNDPNEIISLMPMQYVKSFGWQIVR